MHALDLDEFERHNNKTFRCASGAARDDREILGHLCLAREIFEGLAPKVICGTERSQKLVVNS